MTWHLCNANKCCQYLRLDAIIKRISKTLIVSTTCHCKRKGKVVPDLS
jgi:hypothetical protein